jgi:divalent metal cation (Fe/Co/Zn/Cd) transporter
MSSHEEHDHFDPRSLYVAAGLTIAYAAIEAGAGWWANSLALMSDAGHMVTDAAALLIATLGAWLAQRKPSLRHSYGLLRAEFLAALINSLLMLAVAGWVMAHAIERLYQPLEVRGEADRRRLYWPAAQYTGAVFAGTRRNRFKPTGCSVTCTERFIELRHCAVIRDHHYFHRLDAY